jgi:thymidylate kinase
MMKSDQQTHEQRDLLMKVFDVLDEAKIAYVVTHGYEAFSKTLISDVDIVIVTQSGVHSKALVKLLHANKHRIGAEMVRSASGYIELVRWGNGMLPCFLALDFTTACEVDGLHILDGVSLLAERQRLQHFWVPSTAVEFSCYLARCVAKRKLDTTRTERLSNLYQSNPKSCDAQIRSFWAAPQDAQFIAAARSGDWSDIVSQQDTLKTDLRSRLRRRKPVRFVLNKFYGFIGKAKRLFRPDGVNVAFLGPDGAGKSSVVDAIGAVLEAALPRSVCWGFAVSPTRLMKRSVTSTDQPHALPSRSLATSLVRAAYWLLFYIVGYPYLHLIKARSTLVINDRHFVDILVDQKRYRYGGPVWVLQLIWRLMPKPELVILLDAPPDVLQSRKQEVAFEVTAKQRNDYYSLVQTLPNGRIVNADQALPLVINDAAGVVLTYMARRLEGRLGLNRD